MTDVAQAEAGQPFIRIMAQYVKDLSFENPRAPQSLRIEGKPEIDMGVEMSARGRTDGLFEVDLKLSIKATGDNQPLFQVELLYGGVFQIEGVAEPDLEPVLLVECPRFLFPFARRIVGDMTSDGGFYPPFLLEPLDFAAIYSARKQAESAQPGQIGHA